MTIALRRQITCYTDLAMILALVDPCPRGVPRPSFTLPSGQTAQATQPLRGAGSLPAYPATSFPKDTTGPEGSMRRMGNDEEAIQ